MQRIIKNHERMIYFVCKTLFAGGGGADRPADAAFRLLEKE
jgi:hypothetical protein